MGKQYDTDIIITPGSPSLPMTRYELYKFQSKYVETCYRKYVEANRCRGFLAADTGTGKTATAIRTADAIADFIQSENPGDKPPPTILVVTDGAVKFQWQEEVMRWSTHPIGMWDVCVIHGDAMQRMLAMMLAQQHHARWVIVNWEVIRDHFAIFQTWFGDPHNNIIIADEADRLQTSGSLRSISIRSLEAQYRMALTATPVANRPDTLYPILHFLDPGEAYWRDREWTGGQALSVRYHYASPYWGSEQGFIQRYCLFNDQGRVVGARNVPDLHRRLEEFGMVRWHKRDPELALELPDIVYEVARVQLTEPQRDLYERLREGVLNWKEDKGAAEWRNVRNDPQARSVYIQSILAMLTHLRRAAGMSTGRMVSNLVRNTNPDFEWDQRGVEETNDNAKALWLAEHLEQEFGLADDMPQYGGVYVWTQWTDVVEDIAATIGDHWIRRTGMERYTGQMSQGARDEVRKRVLGGACKLVLSSPAGGRGLNMQRLDTCCLMDLPWAPKDVDQAVGRVDRVGQKSEMVTVYSVLADETIDTKKMLPVIKAKQADNDKILDGERGGKFKSVVDFDLDDLENWI